MILNKFLLKYPECIDGCKDPINMMELGGTKHKEYVQQQIDNNSLMVIDVIKCHEIQKYQKALLRYGCEVPYINIVEDLNKYLNQNDDE